MRQTIATLVLPATKPRNPIARALHGRRGGVHRGAAARPSQRRELRRELQTLHLHSP
jgi:hypothetical protein